MSYGLQIFHPAVRKRAQEGQELDELEHLALDQDAVARFIEGLNRYGYSLETTTPQYQQFVKYVGRCPIQVAIFDSEIAFSIPYWNSEEAIFEALQDASELIDSEHMALFNPQDGEWAEA